MTAPDAISDLGGTVLHQQHLRLFTGSWAVELPALIIRMLPHGSTWLIQELGIGQALPPHVHSLSGSSWLLQRKIGIHDWWLTRTGFNGKCGVGQL